MRAVLRTLVFVGQEPVFHTLRQPRDLVEYQHQTIFPIRTLSERIKPPRKVLGGSSIRLNEKEMNMETRPAKLLSSWSAVVASVAQTSRSARPKVAVVSASSANVARHRRGHRGAAAPPSAQPPTSARWHQINLAIDKTVKPSMVSRSATPWSTPARHLAQPRAVPNGCCKSYCSQEGCPWERLS